MGDVERSLGSIAAADSRAEALRPEAERSAAELEKLAARMTRCLDALEQEAPDLDRPANLGAIATAVACAYADFRYPDLDWRTGRPRLTAFSAAYDERPSMRATRLFE